jgi:putative ABC transport system permease protein
MSKRSDDLDRGLNEEIQFHLEQEIQKQMRLGHSPEEARRRAYVRFGGVEPLKERTRDEFRPALLQDFGRDMKVGARMLTRTPAFALAAILTIGLGTGAATAVFSVVNGVLLRPLPYPESDRLVRLYQLDNKGSRNNVSGPNFEDWQAGTRSFASMARLNFWGPTAVAGGSEPVLATTTLVSKEFFEVMRVSPARGRAFSPEEQAVGGVPAAIVSHNFWMRSLDAAPDFGRRALRMGDRAYAVVGVMPEGFDYPNGTALWLARELNPPDKSRTAHNFQGIARLADGVRLETARADISSVSRALKDRHGDGTWMSDATAVPLLEQLTTTSRPALRLLFGAALLLLVIAVMNVSSLLLARAAARRRDFAVQLAIGAGRARLVRQLLAETSVLCLAGGAIGTLTAAWGVKALVALGPTSTPRLAEARVDWVALAFALGISAAAAIVLGLLAGLGARDAHLSSALSDASRGGTLSRRGVITRQTLVAGQVALTLLLLSGTGLLARSFVRVLAIEPGFRLDDAMIVDMALTAGGSDFRQKRPAQIDTLLERFRALPGVTDAAMTSGFPLGGGNYSNGQFFEMSSVDEFKSYADVARLGAAAKERAGFAGFRIASPGYFRAMGIPLLHGRLFEDTDTQDGGHVAVISQSLANARWPGRDPIGRYVQFGNMDGDPKGFRVIGVVGDVRELTLEVPPAPLFYAFYRQRPNSVWRVSFVVRGPSPDSLAGVVPRLVRDVDPDLPFQLGTVTQAFDTALSSRRFSLLLISVFGGAALVLAMLGLYAVIAYLVQQRTREIGIRMALGATPAALFRLVAGRGVLLAIAGCATGVAGVLLLGPVAVQSLLFGVTPTDPIVLGAVAAITVAASLAASLLPARRATRVSPIESLRS